MPADPVHDEGFFGERVASVYDEHAADMFDPAVVTPVVDMLAGFAGQGGALELGIGTGRIALPLADIPFRAEPGGVSFDVYDVVSQRFSSQHLDFVDGRVEAHPVEFRYAWPAELDLMARLAGLRLQDRWAGWRREPFTSLSRAHVSVYEKP